MLTVIRFRVGYVHLSLILILKSRKCHKEIAKTYLGLTMHALTRISEFPAMLFPTAGLMVQFHALDEVTFSGNFLMIHLDSFCLVIALAGPSPKLGH